MSRTHIKLWKIIKIFFAWLIASFLVSGIIWAIMYALWHKDLENFKLIYIALFGLALSISFRDEFWKKVKPILKIKTYGEERRT